MPTKKYIEVFTERLNALIKENNMSYVQLAEILEVNNSTLSMWKQGYSFPRTEMLEKIADFFNVSPAFLMGWNTNNVGDAYKKTMANVLGRVAAGAPLKAIEDIIDTEETK